MRCRSHRRTPRSPSPSRPRASAATPAACSALRSQALAPGLACPQPASSASVSASASGACDLRESVALGRRSWRAEKVARALASILRWGAMRLRLYHHPDGARVAYRELGAGPPLALLALRAALPQGVGACRRAARRPLPRGAARPAAARRLRGPPAPPLHARLVRRGARRLRAEVLGPRPLLAGHDAGAEILLHAVARGCCARHASC